MAQDKSRQNTSMSEEVAQNPGARAAAVHQNPELAKEQAKNANEGEGPNAAGGMTKPSTVEGRVRGSDEPEASDLPTANTPDPDQANPSNPNAS
jgi:hypothetical protein